MKGSLPRLIAVLTAYLAILPLATLEACSSPRQEPTVGSNSNWLKACDVASDCGASSACTCGACTVACRSDTDCANFAGSRCASASTPAALSACQLPDTGLCLPTCDAGGCGVGQSCVSGSCVLTMLPNSEFCTTEADRTQTERTHEDELLNLLQQTRVAGTDCGTGSTSAPPLRLDVSLICAARVFASDVARTHSQSLVDSAERNTQVRMALAGYTQTYWAELFTLDATSPPAALATWLAKPDLCSQLLDPKYTDVGLGSAGSTYVVTLGSH